MVGYLKCKCIGHCVDDIWLFAKKNEYIMHNILFEWYTYNNIWEMAYCVYCKMTPYKTKCASYYIHVETCKQIYELKEENKMLHRNNVVDSTKPNVNTVTQQLNKGRNNEILIQTEIRINLGILYNLLQLKCASTVVDNIFDAEQYANAFVAELLTGNNSIIDLYCKRGGTYRQGVIFLMTQIISEFDEHPRNQPVIDKLNTLRNNIILSYH